jgi:hypothetical protein
MSAEKKSPPLVWPNRNHLDEERPIPMILPTGEGSDDLWREQQLRLNLIQQVKLIAAMAANAQLPLCCKLLSDAAARMYQMLIDSAPRADLQQITAAWEMTPTLTKKPARVVPGSTVAARRKAAAAKPPRFTSRDQAMAFLDAYEAEVRSSLNGRG